MRVLELILVFLIKLIILINNATANEVVGCGGFIKSHADIDFSKVEIKLFTKQGSLKDKTDCSPSNGYYFLPIYDKGEYLLRISPPPGWSFEPQQVELNFDGETDFCSKGSDVNFAFKGFGITGKVNFAQGNGARGVSVELKSQDGTDVRRSETDIFGIFSFTPIIPGKYVIKVSHPKWHFSADEHVVIVVSGNTELPENSLVVLGFDVSGRFETNGELTSGIGVALFKHKSQTLELQCERDVSIALKADKTDYTAVSVCFTNVDSSSSYTFQGVPPGKYLIQPIVANSDLKLHISPLLHEFEVGKDALEIKDHFKITGFSVTGSVLTGKGDPLPGAVIKLNGQVVAKSGVDGTYLLQNVKSGIFTLQVEAPRLQFNEQQVQIQLSTPTLPEVVPSAYEVCGKVVSQQSFVVAFTQEGSTFHGSVSSKPATGEWCYYLSAGRYIIEVLTTDVDKASGVKFFPLQKNIEVVAQPLNGITFSQLRAKLSGIIKCLPDSSVLCTSAEVTIHSIDAVGQPTGQTQTTKALDGKYSFKNLLPGPYELTIPHTNLCFDSTRVFINIAAATESALPFVHRGYEVSIIASHRAIMKYAYLSNANSVDTIKLNAGVNTFCVPKFGSYSIKLEGCHLYDDNLPKTFSTADSNPIRVTAVAHKVGVIVLSPVSNDDSLTLTVESASLGKQIFKPTPEVHKVDGMFAFRYDTYLRPEEVLHITPKSDFLLFTPQSKELLGPHDCIDIAFNFIAVRGLILHGKVVPPIENVKITLSFPQNSALTAIIDNTTLDGEFKFRPIDEKLSYELTAEKESYVFSDFDKVTETFSAHKLCEILVKVRDDAGKVLSGVLLSLSGAESYRRNLVTGENGAINFHSLSPSQYFLRPMMKEYKFEPNSKIIEIKDGETVDVELVGKRVAYSIFGTISSLNGEPFSQVNIEAISDENCMHHQEEATSENNGQYRLRGLQPDCSYTVSPKDAGAPTSNVDRSIPSSRRVKIANDDVRDVNLIAISPITFVDVTARITASHNDYYKTLRIVMYRKGASDSPIYSQRVETPLNPKSRYNPGIMVFFPRMPLDGKTYFVELKSTLTDKTYIYKLPVEQFVANTSSIFIELDFKPEVRAAEADLNQNSISALVLVALVAIAFFKQDIAILFLNFILSKVNHIAQRQRSSSKKDVRKNEPINQREIDQMADQINAIKKKKTKKI